MPRPLKYVPGDVIPSMAALVEELEGNRFVIVKTTGQRVHPGWAASWQLNVAMNAIRSRSLLYAIPNPDHPDNKDPK